jgi:hypothetical protein
MAHTFANIGFETAGATPGYASAWTCVFVATAEEFAGYDVAVPEPWEDFEEEWSTNNEAGKFNWSQVTASTASYDVTPAQTFEDFEEEWANEPHLWALAVTGTALYNTALDPEDAFEWGWNSNQNDVFDWGDIPSTATASFDAGAPEAREDFEEEWRDNEDDITEFTGGDVLAGTFDGENFEDFEEVDLRMYTFEVTDVGADGDRLIVYVNGAPVERQCTGVGTVDSERDFLVTAINAAVLGATVSADGTGKAKVRATTSGDSLSIKVEATGANAKIVLNTPPDKTAFWTQTGELGA